LLTLRPLALGLIVEGLQDSSLDTAPCASTPHLPDATAHDQIPQAFPLCICTTSDQILEVGTA